MGDIGSAISGGINGLASVYQANMYREGVHETNDMNYQIHKEDNQFNSDEAEKGRNFNWETQQESQRFNAEQSDLNRQFQSDEAEKGRQWQEDMYNKYQSPEALASQYERLGINPSAVLGGQSGNFNTTSLPSGSSASSSPVSGGSASAGAAPQMVAPQMTDNPVSAFLAAYQDSQRTQSQVQQTKLQNEYQKVQNQFAARQEMSKLKERNANIDKLLSDKGLNDESRKKLESERKLNDWNLKIIENSYLDTIELTHQERLKRENENKLLVLQAAKQEIENKYLPRLMGSQANLNESEAKAVLKSAEAAMQQALVAKYDAKTRRMQFRFDQKKYNEVLKDNIKASTRQMQANAEYQETENSHYEEKRIYDITHESMGDISKMLMTLLGMFGLGKLKVVGSKGVSNPY